MKTKFQELRQYAEYRVKYQKDITLDHVKNAIADLQLVQKYIQENTTTSGNGYMHSVQNVAEAISRLETMQQDLGAIIQTISA